MRFDLALLLAQLVLVLVVARVAGALLARIGQPAVIGEMIAGIALGPSLLGAVAPAVFEAVFPADRLVPLAALAQLGVLLFMFVVGLRLDLGVLRGRAGAAVAVSHASIVAPFVLGMALAPAIHARLAPDGVGLLPFALFLGAAMSVTAFPVLARILADRGLMGTRIGTVAIASAAVDDVSAWCILAAVVAVAQASGAGAAGAVGAFVATVGLAGAWALLLLLVGRVALARLAGRARPAEVSPALVSVAVIGALASAWVTEAAGVHALFGAFLAGAVVPRAALGGTAPSPTGLAATLADRIEAVTASVLLPIFFAYTGLRTAIGLVDGAAMWAITALVLAVAIAGKVGGSAAAARFLGMPWREALSIGALMNTRGLMELVILNVGLDIGVISPPLFAMMVVMALVTTAMTAPALALVARVRGGWLDAVPARAASRS
jgi:Kef-type K+ transport system membrane component KefB